MLPSNAPGANLDLLPHESQIQNAVARMLASELSLVRDLLGVGVGMLGTKDVHGVGLPHDNVITACALFVKASLSFRTSIHLCEAGLDRSAMPVSRSLFETYLNLAFLIRRRVSLYQFNDSKKKPKTPWPLFGKNLTPEFRTALYNAWSILRDEKEARDLERTPGFKRAGRQFSKRLAACDRGYVDQIGSDWEKRIKGANTCVGLSIADFVASLSPALRGWHRIVYAKDSSSVHQSDMMTYLEFDQETASFCPRWHSSPKEVKTALQKSAQVYLCCVGEMDKRFDFGSDVHSRLKDFGAELQNWDV